MNGQVKRLSASGQILPVIGIRRHLACENLVRLPQDSREYLRFAVERRDEGRPGGVRLGGRPGRAAIERVRKKRRQQEKKRRFQSDRVTYVFMGLQQTIVRMRLLPKDRHRQARMKARRATVGDQVLAITGFGQPVLAQ